MPSQCPTYEPPFSGQLAQGGATGPVDCMAWACSRAIGHATCGAKLPTGRAIRLRSNEPVPDPMSPGLNLRQVADVARIHYGVYLEVHGSTLTQVSWSEYEDRRKDGQGCVIALGYAPIADSKYDAGRGFRANHGMFESHLTTYDPLADGRAPGVWDYDGSVYTRSIIRDAAGELNLGSSTVKDGYVWAAFTRDVVPDFQARVPRGSWFWVYHLAGDYVLWREKDYTANGFRAAASPPRSYRVHSTRRHAFPLRSYTLGGLLDGSREGLFIGAQYVYDI